MQTITTHDPHKAQRAVIAGLGERKRLQSATVITATQQGSAFTITVHDENKQHERLIAEAILQQGGKPERMKEWPGRP